MKSLALRRCRFGKEFEALFLLGAEQNTRYSRNIDSTHTIDTIVVSIVHIPTYMGRFLRSRVCTFVFVRVCVHTCILVLVGLMKFARAKINYEYTYTRQTPSSISSVQKCNALYYGTYGKVRVSSYVRICLAACKSLYEEYE